MIGGNVKATLEKLTTNKNEIGEDVPTWAEHLKIEGFLDLMSGGADFSNYNAKIQESSHVFICDYQPIDLKESECRLVINKKVYEILLIDDPMELHEQLEFYLKYTGD